MGSMASFDAGVKVVYSRKLRVTKVNSLAEIENFMQKNPRFGKYVEIDFEEATLENLENEKYFGYAGELYNETEEAWNTEDYTNTFRYSVDEVDDLRAVVKMKLSEFKFLNLEVLSEYKALPYNGNVDKEIYLANDSGYIYCDNDNSTYSEFNIPKEILQDLMDKKCKIVLEANGDGEHC